MDICGLASTQYAAAYQPQGVPAKGTGNFLSQMEAARCAPQARDTASLSALSYERRLAELQNIHENTDYSGMEQKDIYRLIFQRFQDAFPNYWAIGGGLYLCAGENSIYEKVWNEMSRQFSEANNGEHLQRPSDPAEEMRFNRYIHGYDEDSSDEELLEKISEKYSGGTLADRCGMAWRCTA